jgi:hypothetical protein
MSVATNVYLEKLRRVWDEDRAFVVMLQLRVKGIACLSWARKALTNRVISRRCVTF